MHRAPLHTHAVQTALLKMDAAFQRSYPWELVLKYDRLRSFVIDWKYIMHVYKYSLLMAPLGLPSLTMATKQMSLYTDQSV